MKNPLVLIYVLMVVVFMYLVYDTGWGITSEWVKSDKLALWQFSITGIAVVVAVATLIYAYRGFERNRTQEKETRNESLSQIIYSLKSELETNLAILQNEEFRIWIDDESDEDKRISILTRPLRISAFELLAGREDLKYLSPPTALAIIAEAYNQIKNFNDVLESWISRAFSHEDVAVRVSPHAMRTIDVTEHTAKLLDEEKTKTIKKVISALRVLTRIER